jgi:hypothetical protein
VLCNNKNLSAKIVYKRVKLQRKAIYDEENIKELF